MKTNKIIIIAALLGTTLVACQKTEELKQPADEQQGWKINVQVYKDADTKAMELSGSKLNTYWKKGEEVAVYFGGIKMGTLAVTTDDNVNPAELAGQVSKPAGLTTGSPIMLLFPGREDNQWTYVGQDGSAPSATGNLASFDYASASFTVSTIDNVNNEIVLSGATSFTAEQSVYRFGFLVDGAGSAIAVKSILLTSNQGKLVRTRTYSGSNWVSNYGSLSMTATTTAPDGNLYSMAIRNENTTNDDTFSFCVVGNSDNALYEGTKVVPSANLGNGKFLSAKTISVSQKSFAPATSGSVSNVSDVL